MACGTQACRRGMSVGGPCVLSELSLAETSTADVASSSSPCAAALRLWNWRTEGYSYSGQWVVHVVSMGLLNFGSVFLLFVLWLMLFGRGGLGGAARLKGGLDMCLLSVIEHTRNVVSDMVAVGV